MAGQPEDGQLTDWRNLCDCVSALSITLERERNIVFVAVVACKSMAPAAAAAEDEDNVGGG